MNVFKKIFLTASFLSLFPLVASGQAANQAAASMFQSIALTGSSIGYATAHIPPCSKPGGQAACMQIIKGLMEAMKAMQAAGESKGSASDLLNGSFDQFKFDPVKAGFCFDKSKGCKPTGVDASLKSFETAFKTGEGYDEALAKLKGDTNKKLASFAGKGYKIDSKAGTITAPNGLKTSLNDYSNFPKDLSKATSDRINGINAQLGLGGRGVASVAAVGSGGGGVFYKNEYLGGKSRFKKDNLKKKKDKNSFLAGLSDKDAAASGIGIAGDNIFGMVNRRYGKKVKSAEFLKE